ncbi:undecaprenyl-diphosphate phosphatase [Salinicola rhizosphaerae]|uniref:Undecaprenyl-diphosphatase n=1 Tax=Salinicola rhizosphaerae TaxID=1443141 RepID=A0ABQ3E5A9_9GAMM|nr:undecaprenyl-diphosphate phosphatase [Salinicola rhizosphaerae]GHB22902.1 undecaprenyl-diphosphatase [Salinicola rhizosphaerae]
MDVFHLAALAIIQGLTEFLPISSSAHLILPSQILGWSDQGLAFDVAVHIGSLGAVLFAFRHEVWRILHAWFTQFGSRGQTPESRLGWAIIVATIPAVIFGLAIEDWVESAGRSVLVIATTTVVFGVLLGVADKRGSRVQPIEKMTLKTALLIGLAQAIALIPGTSRSGITMTAALMLGFTRQAAARFSFLLSIPLILAAGSLKGLELAQSGTATQWHEIALGVVFSFVAAWLCIKLFLAALDKIGMMPFVVYRILLGIALFVWAT